MSMHAACGTLRASCLIALHAALPGALNIEMVGKYHGKATLFLLGRCLPRICPGMHAQARTHVHVHTCTNTQLFPWGTERADSTGHHCPTCFIHFADGERDWLNAAFVAVDNICGLPVVLLDVSHACLCMRCSCSVCTPTRSLEHLKCCAKHRDFDVDIVELSCIVDNWSWNYNFCFQVTCTHASTHACARACTHAETQMMMPVLIALILAFKTIGSALLLRLKSSKGLMSIIRRGMCSIFDAPDDEAQLRQMAFVHFSTLIGVTNVLYASSSPSTQRCVCLIMNTWMNTYAGI